MIRWSITFVLLCVTVGFGIYAWNIASQRTPIIWMECDREAVKWAEKAKRDKWLELVVQDGGALTDEGRYQLTYGPVPNDEIDDYIGANPCVTIRRWIPIEEMASMAVRLHNSGTHSGTGEWAKETSDEASTQRTKTMWLTITAIVAGVTSVASGVLAWQRTRKGKSL